MIDSFVAINFLIEANGDSKYAASKADISEAELLTAIAQDPAAMGQLAQQVQVKSLLLAMDTFRIAHSRVRELMPTLTGRDATTFYTSLLKSMSSMVAGPTTAPPDPGEAIMRRLPPEMADHIQALIQAGSFNPNPASSTPTPSVPGLSLNFADDDPDDSSATSPSGGYALPPGVKGRAA